MNILFLPNWQIHRLDKDNQRIQSPDKIIEGEPYWFFRYFPTDTTVKVIDIGDDGLLLRIQKKLKFYIIQPTKAFFARNRYDIVISHGAQSGLFFELLCSFFKRNPIHLIIDVGGLNGSKVNNIATPFIRFAMRKSPGIIIHSSKQISLYEVAYRNLINKVTFIPFGVDFDYFSLFAPKPINENQILSFGYAKRDYPTLFKAWSESKTGEKYLKIIGIPEDENPKHRGIECLAKTDLFSLMSEISSSLFIVIPLPEYNYSYGQMSFLQSMAMGKVLIVTRTTSSVDYLSEAPGIILCDPHSVNSMKCAIESMLQWPLEKIIRMGEANKKHIRSRYTEKKMATAIFNKCIDLLAHQ